jgi:hypothetical protein
MRFAIKISTIAVMSLLFISIPILSRADQFDHYREYIDNYQKYTSYQREQSIRKLEAMKTTDIERNYLLGMLYMLQGIDSMTSFAQSKQEKPKAEEVLKEPVVRNYFEKAQQNYDAVEKAHPGYKFIYCKYAELYRYSFNDAGLRKVTSRIGSTSQSESTAQCKSAIEDIAEGFASHGYANISKVIYEEAVKNWKPYPKYMLEALGDIANVQNNPSQSKYWWKRCVDEAEKDDRKIRCQEKLKSKN